MLWSHFSWINTKFSIIIIKVLTFIIFNLTQRFIRFIIIRRQVQLSSFKLCELSFVLIFVLF
jgi:hypothetical protein